MDQNQLYDIQTIEVMKRVLSDNSNCIDVGCHTGVFLDEILKLAPKGFHYGFEPLPDLSKLLTSKFKGFDKVEIQGLALSDVDGEAIFQHVVSNPGYSGLKQRRYDKPNEEIKQITVLTKRLDDIIQHSISISFIKIDCEGAELQVLRGAAETLKRCKPVIVFEHGLGAADFYGTEPDMVFDLLEECGLCCFTMEQWLDTNGEKNLNKKEFIDNFKSGRHYYFMAAV